MTIDFNCMTTGIGSLPHTDPDEAARLSISFLSQAPIWPQLPRRGFREHMDCQYSESLPGIVIDEEKGRCFFETKRDITPELERFFERYIAKDYGFFGMSEAYAAGFHAFLRALARGEASGAGFFKGHVTGPLTFGTSVKDEAGRDIIHNELLFDAVVKGLAMKAAWQIETLKPFGKPVVIFIDEPAMESLGSAFSAVSQEVVAEKLNEVIDAIHELGGIAGIHCCGNADWPMIFRTRIDIVNFDAFGYMEKVLLYPEEIKAFYYRGGSLAWGIVPTSAFTRSEKPDELVTRLEAGVLRLEQAGIDRSLIKKRCILTPSCGMGSLAPEKAVAILRMLEEVALKAKGI